MKNKGEILGADDNQGICNALKLLLAPHFAEVEVIASPKMIISVMGRFKLNVCCWI